MESDKKYALLDTDFLYKAHLARNNVSHTLADLVITFDDYKFFCHEMIREELTRREIYPDPNPWLEEKIKDGRIELYTDQDIIDELRKAYGMLATYAYLTYLRISCNTFNTGFFERYYGVLEEMENLIDAGKFLKALQKCDDSIPHKSGLGEKKSFVLIQMLEFLYDKDVYVFCSDDFKARQSIAGLPNPINCISILGVFYKLMKLGHGKLEMQEYYFHLSDFLKNQTEYKVWSKSGYQRVGVPIEQLFDEMYAGKFQLLRNGDLQYCS